MSKKRVLSVLCMGLFLWVGTLAFGAEDRSKLIEGAKKEGKVVYWAAGLTPDLAKAIESGLKKKYGLPGSFEVLFVPSVTAETVSKATQEIKYGRVTVDIICGGMPEFFYDLKRAGELMRYDSPEYKFFPPVKGISSEPGYWVATNALSPVMMWNPKFVKKNITTYNDLLDPEFKGMICSADPKKSESYLGDYMGLRKVLSKEFMTKLAKQGPIIWLTRGPDVLNKVVTGERPVTFMGNNRNAYVASLEGANIKVCFPKEGITVRANNWPILAKAPHPNAAKLLIDYVHSEEGQRLMAEMSGYFIGRKGVPIPQKVREFTPPLTDINIIPVDWTTMTADDMKKGRKEFIEIFGE